MKTAVLINSSDFAGAEKAVFNLVNFLEKDKSIFLIVNDEIKKYYNKLGKNVFIFVLPSSQKNIFSKIFTFFKKRRMLREFCLKNKIYLLNAHLGGSFCLTFNFKDIKVIPTLHGTDINDFLNFKINPLSILDKVVVGKSIKDAPKIISVSRHQIQNLPEKYKSKTVVIPNGVDSKVFRPLKNIKQEKNVILFTGRFIDIKGIREIINVAKQLPQYEFWFAGQGPLANFINLSNTKNLGFKTAEDLVKLYNQATICVFPSYREGLPLCGLEAMSCGKAVIATPLGFSEYIENGKDGIIIPAKDENALKNAIVDLMTHEKRIKMLERNARKKALQYSWEKITKQYLDVFKEVSKK